MSDSPERRHAERIQKHDRVVILRGDEETSSLTGQVMNISEGGIRFITDCAFDSDELVGVKVGDTTHRARVLDCAKRFNGFAVRAEFMDG